MLLRTTLKIIALAAPILMGLPNAGAAQSANTEAAVLIDDWSRFVSPQDLSALQQEHPDVQVIDIRDEKYMDTGSIPGAVWVTFSKWRGPAERPGQPPTEDELEALIGDHGLNPNLPVVIHNHSGHVVQTGRAAIVYWILKSSGMNNIAILDGCFKAWSAADLPRASEPTILPTTVVDVTQRHDWWAGPLEVFAVATQQMDGAILDARLDGQVKRSIETGKPLMSMPLAQFIPSSFFTNDLAAKNLTEDAQNAFRSDLQARGIDLGEGILISVCQTGELSAVSWFYASEIVGIENVLYYPDALQGWESDGGLMFGMSLSQ